MMRSRLRLTMHDKSSRTSRRTKLLLFTVLLISLRQHVLELAVFELIISLLLNSDEAKLDNIDHNAKSYAKLFCSCIFFLHVKLNRMAGLTFWWSVVSDADANTSNFDVFHRFFCLKWMKIANSAFCIPNITKVKIAPIAAENKNNEATSQEQHQRSNSHCSSSDSRLFVVLSFFVQQGEGRNPVIGLRMRPFAECQIQRSPNRMLNGLSNQLAAARPIMRNFVWFCGLINSVNDLFNNIMKFLRPLLD